MVIKASLQFNNGLKKKVQAPDACKDFLEFDGNAQTFRLLTRLQVLNDNYGLNLTLGTLAALIKYPSVYDSAIIKVALRSMESL